MGKKGNLSGKNCISKHKKGFKTFTGSEPLKLKFSDDSKSYEAAS